MAKIAVWNWKKEKVGEVDLPADVFDVPVPRAPRVGGRARPTSPGSAPGTHKTKIRSRGLRLRQEALQAEGDRPRARRAAAARRSTATAARSHGPVPRSYAQGVSVGEKKNALKAVLSRRRRGGAASSSSTRSTSTSAQDQGPQGRGRRRSASRARRSSWTRADNENFAARLAQRRRAGSSSIRSRVNAYDVLDATATVVLSKHGAVARRQDAGRLSDGSAADHPPAPDHREGHADRRKAPTRSASRWTATANKIEIRRAVEKLFGVKVRRRSRRQPSRASGSAWAGSSASAGTGRRPTSGSRRTRSPSSSSRACRTHGTSRSSNRRPPERRFQTRLDFEELSRRRARRSASRSGCARPAAATTRGA